MLKTLLDSEERCRQYSLKAASWLLDLYNSQDGAFYISVSSNEALKPIERPNVATSHIGVVIDELVRSGRHNHLTPDEDKLAVVSRDTRVKFLACEPNRLLPLETFGPLPAFSTTFASEFLSASDECLHSWSYAILARRILSLMQSELGRDGRVGDLLHPYLWYRLACAGQRLFQRLRESPRDLTDVFLGMVRNRAEIVARVPRLKEATPNLTGFEDNPEFEVFLKGFRLEALTQLLRQIEQQAMVDASTELAWLGTPRKSRVDGGRLLFSIATLLALDSSRHELLITQSVPAILDCFEHGALQLKAPFNIDDRGRALFVTTLESASTLATVLLAIRETASNEQLRDWFSATEEIQSRAIEDVNDVQCSLGGGDFVHRLGWCSDKAYSENRVDSWVTVHGLAFLSRRLRLTRYIKKRDVLSRYSWIPAASCKPTWDELVDPNLGEPHENLLLSNVMEIASKKYRGRAPLFLLYGPPGTAKTSIAHGLARQLGWDLITLSPSDFVINSLDQIEQRSREIFEDLSNVEECVVLFDEMDTLLRDREDLWSRSPGMMIEFVVPALLPKLQQFRDYANDRPIAAFFATNFYERLDNALTRAGRIDNHLAVLPYSRPAQRAVARAIFSRRGNGTVDELCAKMDLVLAAASCNLTYRDVEQLCSGVLAGKTVDELKATVGRMGLSPDEIYKGREKATRELFAFLRRYRGETVLTDVQPDQIIDYLKECRDHLPQFAGFLAKRIEYLTTNR